MRAPADGTRMWTGATPARAACEPSGGTSEANGKRSDASWRMASMSFASDTPSSIERTPQGALDRLLDGPMVSQYSNAFSYAR